MKIEVIFAMKVMNYLKTQYFTRSNFGFDEEFWKSPRKYF